MLPTCRCFSGMEGRSGDSHSNRSLESYQQEVPPTKHPIPEVSNAEEQSVMVISRGTEADVKVSPAPQETLADTPTKSKRGIQRTTNLISCTVEKDSLVKSGAILSDLMEGRVPDMATFKLSLLPRVNTSAYETQNSFSEEKLTSYLTITFEGEALQNCQNKTHYCSMSLFTTLRDNHNHLTLQCEPFEYDIRNVDQTGVRCFTPDIATLQDVKELKSSQITLDCETIFTLHCT